MFVTKVIIFKWPVVTSWIADDDDIYIMVECTGSHRIDLPSHCSPTCH